MEDSKIAKKRKVVDMVGLEKNGMEVLCQKCQKIMSDVGQKPAGMGARSSSWMEPVVGKNDLSQKSQGT